MPAKKVEIEISAKIDALDRALAQAEAKTRSTMNRINAAGAGGGGVANSLGINAGPDQFAMDRMRAQRAQLERMQDRQRIASRSAELGSSNPLESSRSFGAAKSGADGVAMSLEKVGKAMAVIKAAAVLLEVGVAAYRKDWDKVGEAVQSLPFGIGDMSRAVMQLKADWTGATAELEKYKALSKQLDEDNTQRRKAADSTKSARESTKQRIAELGREMGGLGLTGSNQESYGLASDLQGRLDDIKRQKEAAIKASGSDVTSAEARKIASFYDQQASAEIELTRRKQLEVEKRQKLNEDQLRSEKRIAELKYAGDEIEAKREEIQQKYRAPLMNATTATERGLLTGRRNYELLLAERENMDEKYKKRREQAEEIWDKHEVAKEKAKDKLKQMSDIISGQKLGATDAGFLTRGTGTDRAAELLKTQTRLQEETNRILREQLTKDKQKAAFVQAVGF